MDSDCRKNIYGFIYKITNTINGKTYIGQHIGSSFGDYWGSGVLLHKAYEKHGKFAFKREIVDFASSKKELDFMERFYIQHFHSTVPYGYNISEGGRGGFTGFSTEESRAKISRALKGRLISKEHRNKISKAKKGIPNHKQTEETKSKISRSHIGIEPWNKGKGKKNQPIYY